MTLEPLLGSTALHQADVSWNASSELGDAEVGRDAGAAKRVSKPPKPFNAKPPEAPRTLQHSTARSPQTPLMALVGDLQPTVDAGAARRILLLGDLLLDSSVKAYSVIYDSGSVPGKAIFSSREISP